MQLLVTLLTHAEVVSDVVRELPSAPTLRLSHPSSSDAWPYRLSSVSTLHPLLLSFLAGTVFPENIQPFASFFSAHSSSQNLASFLTQLHDNQGSARLKLQKKSDTRTEGCNEHESETQGAQKILKGRKSSVTVLLQHMSLSSVKNAKPKSEKDGIKQLSKRLMQNAFSKRGLLARKEMRENSTKFSHLHLFVCPASSYKSISPYIHGRKGKSVSVAFEEKIWPETGTAELSSCSPRDKPPSLAHTPTLFPFFLYIFALVKRTATHLSQLTLTYSPLPRKKVLPSNVLPCFLPTFAGWTLSELFPTALFSSQFLDQQSLTPQAVESVPLATLSRKPPTTDSFSFVTVFVDHLILTTSGKSSRPQKKKFSASTQTALRI